MKIDGPKSMKIAPQFGVPHPKWDERPLLVIV
jgi:acyl-CoA synthetase (AMP-forming)/AMP-acid ligase II